MPYMGIRNLKDADIKRGSATGDGNTVFAIGWAPPSEQSLWVTINGVTQQDAAYTISGSNITFAVAPTTGDAIEFRGLQSGGTVITPADGSVSSGKMATEAIATAAIVDSAVTSVKIANDTIVNADINSSAAIATSKLADSSNLGLKNAVGTWSAGQRAEITALTSATTITPDFADSNHFSVTLAHNATFANPSNDTAGQSGSIFITQDGTGSRTASWGTDWEFAGGTAPTLTTTAAAVDRIDYIIKSGTSIQAVATLAYA